jgi:uncharacterized protein YndB with AHSA1/START domain
VPITQRKRVLPASPQDIWQLIEDPHHMPRWWPGVNRMEAVEVDRFTQVFMTKRGRPVRMDFHVLASDPPWRRRFEQEIAGSPFERVLGESITEILLEPVGGGTEVTIVLEQKLRGYSRTGGFLLRRATRKRLDEALDGLEQICV